jgi:hypothetical protein
MKFAGSVSAIPAPPLPDHAYDLVGRHAKVDAFDIQRGGLLRQLAAPSQPATVLIFIGFHHFGPATCGAKITKWRPV